MAIEPQNYRELILLTEVVSSPVTAQEVKHQTQKDTTLSPLIQFAYSGWHVKGHLDSLYNPYQIIA